MQAKFLPGVILLVLVAIGSTASEDQTGWSSLLEKLASINFYKQTVVYEQAILQEGIPALKIPPYDPYYIDAQFAIFQDSYENYTDIEIVLNGLNVSDYSHFDINTAELDVEAMKGNLSLYRDHMTFANNDVRATAVDSTGQVVSCNCTYLSGGVYETTFNSIEQLEVVGTILHVKRFDLVLHSNEVSLTGPYSCTGDAQLADDMAGLLFEALSYMEFKLLPETLKQMANNVAIVLNEIFSLRNITYEADSMFADHTPSNKMHQLELEKYAVDQSIPAESIRSFRTHTKHENSNKDLKKSPIKLTWSMN